MVYENHLILGNFLYSKDRIIGFDSVFYSGNSNISELSMLNGQVAYYYPNDQLAALVSYVNGRVAGVCKAYSEKGWPIMIQNFDINMPKELNSYFEISSPYLPGSRQFFFSTYKNGLRKRIKVTSDSLKKLLFNNRNERTVVIYSTERKQVFEASCNGSTRKKGVVKRIYDSIFNAPLFITINDSMSVAMPFKDIVSIPYFQDSVFIRLPSKRSELSFSANEIKYVFFKVSYNVEKDQFIINKMEIHDALQDLEKLHCGRRIINNIKQNQ